jgi:hypothetical protein
MPLVASGSAFYTQSAGFMEEPDPDEPPDSLFQKVYSAVFFTVLMAVLSGGFCAWLAQSAMARLDYDLRRASSGGFEHEDNVFELFYNCGITDWRAQFGIGAAIGAGCAVIHLVRKNRKSGK